MLLLQEGQTGEGGESSIKECCFGNREALGREVLLLFSSLTLWPWNWTFK